MNIIFWNGAYIQEKEATVSIHDRGYHFGDGIYEVIRFYNKKLFHLDDHLERFFTTMHELHLSIPYNKKELAYFLNSLVQKNKIPNGSLYLQLTRGVTPRSHLYIDKKLKPQLLSYLTPIEQRPLQTMKEGVTVILEKDIRWEWCHLKTLNLLPHVMLKNKAASLGAFETILYRSNQGKITVTEATTANVFVVKDGIIYTHPATNSILHGITRKIVLHLAKDLHYPIKEEIFDTSFFLESDEVFLTGTLSEITPIVSVLDHTATNLTMIGNGGRGEITHTLQKAYSDLIQQHCPVNISRP